MPVNRVLLVHCPAIYDEVIFLTGGPAGQAQVTAPQFKQHDWEQRYEIMKIEIPASTEDDPRGVHILGPVGERCRRCLSRISQTGDLTYTDSNEVERQKSGAAPPPQLLVPRR